MGLSPISKYRSFPLAQVALVAVASSGVERQKQGGHRMNNIGVANVVILKRPAVKEADNNLEHHHKYSITAFTQSHESASAKASRRQDSPWLPGKYYLPGTTCPRARRLVKPEAEFLFFIFLTSTYRIIMKDLWYHLHPFIFTQVK